MPCSGPCMQLKLIQNLFFQLVLSIHALAPLMKCLPIMGIPYHVRQVSLTVCRFPGLLINPEHLMLDRPLMLWVKLYFCTIICQFTHKVASLLQV